MSPRDHVIYGAAAAGALYPGLGINALYFWGASFLVDIDHYLDYVYHNGFTDFSLSRMFDYHNILERFWPRKEFLNVEVFHTAEFLAPLYIASRLLGSAALEAVFWGIIFHVLLDMFYLYRLRIFFKRSYSIIEYFIRKHLLERHGLYPAVIYMEAVEIVRNGGGLRAHND